MLRHRARAFFASLELVVHAATNNDLHITSLALNRLGLFGGDLINNLLVNHTSDHVTSFKEAETSALLERKIEDAFEAMLSTSHPFLREYGRSTSSDSVIIVTSPTGRDNSTVAPTSNHPALCPRLQAEDDKTAMPILRSSKNIMGSSPLLSSVVDVNTAKRGANLANYASGEGDAISGSNTYLYSVTSPFIETIETTCFALGITQETAQPAQRVPTKVSIEEQHADVTLISLEPRVPSLFLLFHYVLVECLLFFIVKYRLRAWKPEIGWSWKIEPLTSLSNALILIGSFTRLLVIGGSMFCKIIFLIQSLVSDTLHSTWVQSCAILKNDLWFEEEPSLYLGGLDCYSSNSRPSTRSNSLATPSYESDGFVTAMSTILTLSIPGLVTPLFMRSTASAHRNSFVISIPEGKQAPRHTPVLSSNSSLHLSGIDFHEVSAASSPAFPIKSLKSMDFFGENPTHDILLLSQFPPRGLGFRCTVSCVPSEYELGCVQFSIQVFRNTSHNAKSDFSATIKSPLRLERSTEVCPGSAEVQIALCTYATASPYSHLRAEFEEFLNNDESKKASPDTYLCDNLRQEISPPSKQIEVLGSPSIQEIDEASPNPLPQFPLAAPVTVPGPSSLMTSSGHSINVKRTQGPIRSNSSTFFVHTWMKRPERQINTTPEAMMTQTHSNTFNIKTRKDISSHALLPRRAAASVTICSSHRVGIPTSPSIQGGELLLESQFALPPFLLEF